MKGRQLNIFDDRFVFESPGGCMSMARTEVNGKIDVLSGSFGELMPQEGAETARSLPIEGLFGIYRLLSGPYVAVITKSRSAGKMPSGEEIRLITKMDLFPLFSRSRFLRDEQRKDEERYLALLRTGFDEHQFYFSYDYDITHTLQRIATFDETAAASPVWSRADSRFFWNRPLLTDVIAAGADQWIMPIVSAFVEFESVDQSPHHFEYILFSRRSCFHQGRRFTARGIDSDGNVANFVETEQLLSHRDGRVSSFVQIRGSIPLFWSSPVTLKYAPRVIIKNAPAQAAVAFECHMKDVLGKYQRTIMVNLIDGKKDQKLLGDAYREAVKKFDNDKASLVWFDFHHECRKMRYGNLKKLVDQVDEPFQGYGFFEQKNGVVTRLQSGVVRTNCMDNLDRTNVVQSLFARRSVMMQLGDEAALAGNVLESPFPVFEKVFKNVWANHADAISFLYAGTGALKTDFTRTGKRTTRGALNDGVNSVVRYYLNNFKDGGMQDSIDLLVGKHVPDLRNKSPFVIRQGMETLNSFSKKVGMYFGVVCVLVFSFASEDWTAVGKGQVSVVIVLLSLLILVRKLLGKGHSYGNRFVSRPLLCPEL